MASAVKYVGSYLPPLCAATNDAVGCLNAIADPQAMQVMSGHNPGLKAG
jgi:hypothetical protein